MAAAVLFGAASCAKEDISSSIAGGEVEVTFTANLANLGTRTYGDGTQVNTLRYYVYEQTANGLTLLPALSKGVNDTDELVAVVEGKATVNLPLIKGMTYNILFWADCIENDIEYYSINKETGVVSINSEVGINANDEKRDAFYSIVTNFNPATATSEDTKVELRRPFAQLNAISNAEDLAALANSNVDLSTSAISAEVYTTLDPFASENEQLSNKRLVKFAAANNPDTANGHLSMNYIFAPVNGCLANVTFTFNNSNVGVQSTTTTYTNIPLQRNYKTNIIGKLLTKSTDFTVEIKPGFNDSEYEVVAVNNAAELQDAINTAVPGEPTVIALGGDIDLNDLIASLSSTRAAASTALTVPAGKDIILNLNGANLSYSQKQTGAYSMITNNGKLTIKGNGTISYADFGNGGNYVSNTIVNNGTLVVNDDVVLVNNSDDDVATNGFPHVIDNNCNLTINGGTLTNNTGYSTIRIWCTEDTNTVVTINGGTFNGCVDFQTVSAKPNKGTLTINGGTFNATCATRLLGFGTDVDEMVANIYGGTFNGSVKLNKYVSGEFNSKVYTIYGGTFAEDPSEFVANGYIAKNNNDVYTVEEFVLDANFANNSWDNIALACQLNAVPESWIVGDRKAMTIDGKDYQIAIIGKNHDTYTAGGTAPLTFKLANEVCGTAPMNATQTNTTGWSSSKMRTETMAEILEVMPVKDAIKAVNKETLNGTRDGLETTSDKLFLLSEIEVNGSVYFSNNFAEGSRYAYYTNLDSQIMNDSYWLRGPGKNNDIGFTQINKSGYMANGSAEYACGVVFGFCF